VRTVSLRLRVTVATLVVLALSLAGFAVAVTINYRSGLEQDLNKRLIGGGLALQRTAPSDLKQLTSSLALEGIVVRLGTGSGTVTKLGASEHDRPATVAPPARPGTVRSDGNLLVLEVPVDGSAAAGKPARGRPEVISTARLTASQSSVDSPVRQLIVVEVVAGLIVVALAALLLLLGLRTALSPLARVSRVAARIAAGDRGQRLNPDRPDTELGRMAASFDEMVGALADSVERANRSEAAMRGFLAAASHELRTPIAALHATVETLLREQPPRPERDALEAQLARESARLGTLVDDLLGLARLEGGDSLRREEVDLAEVAREVADDARTHQPDLEIDVSPGDDAIVTGDADALSRAVRNLVDNAVAATGGAGRLRVEVARTDADVVLRVRDDGPGVPSGQRERIFDEFVRLDGNGRPGAGLGLAIVRRIAEQHRGTVVCEDAEHGACFALRIPATIPATYGRDHRVTDPQIVETGALSWKRPQVKTSKGAG